MNVYVGFAGCKVNQFEKSRMQELLMQAGHAPVRLASEADTIIYNTCCVTKKAEYGCRQAIRKYHKENPSARIIVTGCYAERAKEELLAISGVAAVVSNDKKEMIHEIVNDLNAASKAVSSAPLSFDFKRPVRDRSRALLKIQDGCDAFCSYCIVPYVRGKPVSMPSELVLKNLRNLRGEKEVVLTGVHLGKWGVDRGEEFASLMQKIADENYPFRVRLSSLEPKEITPQLLDVLVSMKNLCPHFHIPLQSGCDRILSLMKRNYTTEYFGRTIDQIRAAFPFAGVGIDVIAGFPGETDEDFAKTREFVASLAIDYMHIFTYSPREGTEAFQFSPRMPEKIAKERAAQLKAVDDEKRRQFAERFMDRAVLCLKDKKEGELFRAITREYLKIYTDKDPGDDEFRAMLVQADPPLVRLI